MSREFLWILFPTSEVRWLWAPMAIELHRIFGWSPVFICNTKEDKDFYLSQIPQEVDATGVVPPDIYLNIVENSNLPSEPEALSILKRFESENSTTFVRNMLLPDRHLARSFVFGADMFASSIVSKTATQERSWRAAASVVDFADSLFHDNPPSLVVSMSSGSGMKGTPFSAIAQKNGVPFRNLVHCRFGFRYYWAIDPWQNSPSLNRNLSEADYPSASQMESIQNGLEPTGDFRFYAEKMRKQRRLDRLILAMVGTAVKHAKYRIRGNRKAKMGYSFFGQLRMQLNERKLARYLVGPSTTRLAQLKAEYKYVFFALQVEPEVSLHGLVPEYFDQLNTIAQIAINLPADALLLVKEHPVQIGRRGTGFYDRIRSIPNAVLISELEHSYAVIDRSDLIIAVTSSVAHEAAVMGKKVVYLCPDGPVHSIKHVKHLKNPRDFQQLPALLDGDDWDDEADRKTEGSRYYKAIMEHAVNLDTVGNNVFDRNYVPKAEEVRLVTDPLIASLDSADSPQPLESDEVSNP